jgi:hypothetical protein
MSSRSLRNRTVNPSPESENSPDDWLTDQPEGLEGISAPATSPASESSVNDWPVDQPEELEGLSQAIMIVHPKEEGVT